MPDNHTPTPWSIERPGQPVGSRKKPVIEIVHRHETACTTMSEANAAFIVRAVNAHDALVAALERMLPQAEGCFEHHYGDNPEGGAEPEHIAMARAALKLARGDA